MSLRNPFTQSNSRYGETFYSFVNGQYTSDGGTDLSAFREGLLKAVNEYAKGKFEGDDVRECMVGAVAIRLKDPMFESQTKNKLGNTEIRTELVNTVREELLHFFNRNKEIATKIVEKVSDTQQLRVLAHGHQQPNRVHAQGQAAQRLGPQARPRARH